MTNLTESEISVLKDAGFRDTLVSELHEYVRSSPWLQYQNLFGSNRSLWALSLGITVLAIGLREFFPVLSVKIALIGLIPVVVCMICSFVLVPRADPSDWRRRIYTLAHSAAREPNRAYSWHFDTLKEAAIAINRDDIDRREADALIAFFNRRKRVNWVAFSVVLGALFLPVILVTSTGIFYG